MQLLVIDTEPQESMVIASAFRAVGFVVAELPLEFAVGPKMGSEHFDAIVIGYLAPDEDIQRVLSSIRLRLCDVPFLVIGNRCGDNSIADLLEGGADDATSRPLNLEDLKVRVTALIRRSIYVCPSTLMVSDLEIDTGERTVMCRKRIVQLSPKEYRILEYLACRS